MLFPLNSAGIGVLNAARTTMARMLGNNEAAFESARSQFWVVDAMVSKRKTLQFLEVIFQVSLPVSYREMIPLLISNAAKHKQ